MTAALFAFHAGHAPAVAAWAGGAGQLVDRGAFRIMANGAEVGREEFAIQRHGTGDAQTTLARGTLTMHDGRRIETVLQAVGPDLLLVEYSAAQAEPDGWSVRVSREGDRLRARTVTPWGEKVREYGAHLTAVVLGEGFAHHYFVLGGFGGGVTLHAYARDVEGLAEVPVGDGRPETVLIVGEPVEATRVDFGIGEGAGSAWFDGGARLVRVVIPAQGFAAERLP